MALDFTACEVCITDAWVEISHDDGLNWHTLPAVETINEAIEENAAQQRRHSHNQGSFTDKCGATSRSFAYDIVMQACDNEEASLSCYLTDNDNVDIRIHKSGGGTPASPDVRIACTSAKYVRQPITWDNNSNDPELLTSRFECQVTPTFENFPCDGTLPNP